MAIADGDVFLCTAVGTYAGQRILLTHTYRVFNVIGTVDEATASTSLINEVKGGVGGDVLESAYLALLGTNYNLDAWRAQKIHPVRYVRVEQARNVAGTGSAIAETGNIAAVITLRAALAGRRHISNKHIGPIPGDAATMVAGELTPAYQTLMNTLATGLKSSIIIGPGGYTFVPCIYHRGLVPVTSDIVTSAIQSSVRVQRRRTLRVGE